MTKRRRAAALVVLALFELASGGGPPARADKPDSPGSQRVAHEPVCGPVPAGVARCHARIVVNPSKRRTTTTTTVRPATTTSSSSSSSSTTTTAAAPPSHAGYGPGDLQGAYGLPSLTAGTGQTVAIVDAFDAPTAEADLAVYRSYYRLPACTTTGGCFRKVDQRGGTSYPSPSGSWAQEISLDLDVVSATCPNCNILLVEADSSSFADLAIAVNTVAELGATAISNSYGGSESLFYSAPDQSAYDHPGVAVTASTGDNGYGVQFPASSSYVTAVGGTSLVPAPGTSRGWSETAWGGAGSGCSVFFPKPPWQVDPGCTRRTVADVAAVADPDTGVAVYDSYAYLGRSGWLVFGGTSVGAPLVAAAYALAGNDANGVSGAAPYVGTGALFDVVAGTNGSCDPASPYLCTAGPGYDGPTGLGTPNGIGAF